MMKGAFILTLFVLAAFFDDAAASPPKSTTWWFPHQPWFQWGHPLPPIPAPKWQVDPKIKTCFGDLAGVTACLHQIHQSYETQTVALSPECCNALQQLSDDCSSTVFAKFNNPFFQMALKQCSATPSA